MKGVVQRLISDKGFGFIKGEDGLEYFFHRSACVDDWETIQQGDRVSFASNDGSPKGPRAERVEKSR